MSELKSKRVVQLYFGFQLFFPLLVWLPIFYEYQKHFGLNDGEIFSIQTFYYLAFCFLEIPTGLVADVWGYRRCLRVGSLVLVFSQLFPIFLPTYAGFLLHFLGVALSRSLISGASSAYLYEHLKVNGESGQFKLLEGRSRAYGLVLKVIAWSGVGFLMTWHVTSPYWLTLFAAIAALVFATMMPVSPGQQSENSSSKRIPLSVTLPQVLLRLKAALRSLWGAPYLIFLIFQGVAIFVLGRIIQVNLFQPILSLQGIELPVHGMVMAAMTVFEALGSGYPHALRRWMNDRNAVFAMTLILGATLLLMPVAGSVMVIVLMCLVGLACGLAYPIQKQLFNDAILDSSYRATLMSVESIVDRAVNAVVAMFLGGVMAAPGGLSQFLLIVGGLTVALVAVLFVAFHRFSLKDCQLSKTQF